MSRCKLIRNRNHIFVIVISSNHSQMIGKQGNKRFDGYWVNISPDYFAKECQGFHFVHAQGFEITNHLKIGNAWLKCRNGNISNNMFI